MNIWNLIASSVINDTEFILSILDKEPAPLDVETLVERIFTLYHIAKSYDEGKKTIENIGGVDNYAEFNSEVSFISDFLETTRVEENVGNDPLHGAMQDLLFCIKFYFLASTLPVSTKETLISKKDKIEYQSIKIIEDFLYRGKMKEIHYSPLAPEEYIPLREALFHKIVGFKSVIEVLQSLLESNFTEQKGRPRILIAERIRFLMHHQPEIFNAFIPRWGLNVLDREKQEEPEKSLPDRKDLYHFFHDLQFVLESDFITEENVALMRKLFNAWYGQPHNAIRVERDDLSWLND